jgi:hypothetical protein
MKTNNWYKKAQDQAPVLFKQLKDAIDRGDQDTAFVLKRKLRSLGHDFEDINYTLEMMGNENKTIIARTDAEAQEDLRQQGYWLVKKPMFGGEEWKNDRGEIIYRVPGGDILSIDEYKEQYVKMFTPKTMEEERFKRDWLNTTEETLKQKYQMESDRDSYNAEQYTGFERGNLFE